MSYRKTRMTRARRICELAARPGGVGSEDVQAALDVTDDLACDLIRKAAKAHGLVKLPATCRAGGRARWFSSPALMKTWLDAQHAAALALQAQRPARSGERVPPRQIDIFARPLPGVPGWGSGPVLRAGSQDYRRHQHRSEGQAS